ncbi:ribosome maturation factor RimM [Hoyosella rhizosphaerae]|uniref:Ribosome maturation factor RimM n=1 Tax=Hoyosella rhizosphaerae TaxID=1755582 RepID=A0A916U5I3_9ACTN|nr:ribosome maturation factor RimM [Hoyosella rhizosphaerae]MBN4926239.1 ribosome maturation factor RimM [Hoyosella rhizosphaerae]GGC60984.1 ribosome maturation factor RimM [Hoyosella rhizosphaerae]
MDLVIGRVAKAHGVHGELVVEIRTDDPEARFAPGTTLRGQKGRNGVKENFVVEAAREHSGRLLVRLQGIDDRDAADRIRGTLFLVNSDDIPRSDDDEYYDHELEGLDVRLGDGTTLGKLREVLHTAAGELLAVKTPDGREVLIPFVMEMVPEIDLDAGFVTVTPPDGLLEL